MDRKVISLKDYKRPPYTISDVYLTFDLHEDYTKVNSVINIKKQDSVDGKLPLLELTGEKMKLIKVSMDGKELSSSEYVVDDEKLIIHSPKESFTLEVENKIEPQNNKSLEGLYKSGDVFCSQNEPEGFRKITYFLDRSDVMAKYKTKIIADKTKYPTLLSNGNKIDSGEIEDGNRHWILWEDPFFKPSYLYAMVAGDFDVCHDAFTTMSGRTIDLYIYVDKGNLYRTEHAMESLKKSMKWDEEVYGREYDLDIFMIVAVDAFNMGAMENKGLNIFNSSLILANPKTATDHDYFRIEGVIGHEYFHNWTGNRITCRDWFQLTLKEGLTVFRDQEFSADVFNRSLQRIDDADMLRKGQFPEDAGPNAHPIKPKSFIEINNFYTYTIYHKGAEVIRMIHTLIGPQAFRKGMDIYFEQYDGQAVTTEEFITSMEEGSKIDLAQFRLWYDQAGTPDLDVRGDYDEFNKKYTLTVKQSCPATPDYVGEKKPFMMPLTVGLVGEQGDLANKVLILKDREESFVFENINQRPVASINRNFSAPVNIQDDLSLEDRIFLLARDPDGFNRWDAMQGLAKRIILKISEDIQNEKELILREDFILAFGKILTDRNIDDAYRDRVIILPSIDLIADGVNKPDFDAIDNARKFVIKTLAKAHKQEFLSIFERCSYTGAYEYNSEHVGRRALRCSAVFYLSSLHQEDPKMIDLCHDQYMSADNMTEKAESMNYIAEIDSPKRKAVLDNFYNTFKDDFQVINKWFTAQALANYPTVLENVKRLLKDPIFDITNPNRIRALIAAFIQNTVPFHNVDGSGYQFIADQVIEVDKNNPTMSSRLAGAFNLVAKLDDNRKSKMIVQLERILEVKDLSKNAYEIVSKTLESAKK